MNDRIPKMPYIRGIFPAVLIILTSCSAFPAIRGSYTPEELYRDAAGLVGRAVTVRGKVEVVSVTCTEIACPADDPCCNLCYYALGFKIDAFHNIYFSGDAAECTGDSCHAECRELLAGVFYEIQGTLWEDFGDVYYLELSEWKQVDPGRRE